MECKCELVEIQNGEWFVAFSECIRGYQLFGPFKSKMEASYYVQEYFPRFTKMYSVIDFEHPMHREKVISIKGPPFRERLWDFEDYKAMAWRNAGFRSRK